MLNFSDNFLKRSSKKRLMELNKKAPDQKDSPKSVGLTPMMAQYKAIKDQHPDTLLFYQMGEFYELFFEDAITGSKILEIALTKRGQSNGDDIPMCGVPIHTATPYIEKIIKSGYQIAICEQMESPEEAKKRGYKAVVKREVTRIITQGTLTEENLLSQKQHNFLTSIFPSGNTIYSARIDISTGDFILETFQLAELNAFLGRIQPAEILLPESFLNTPEMFEIFAEWKNKLSPMAETNFRSKKCKDELQKIYNTRSLEAFGEFQDGDLRAAGSLIDYLILTGRGSIPSLKPLMRIDSKDILQIDASTRRHLELLKKIDGSKKGSLLDSIDFTMTAVGGRLLQDRLQAPSTNVQAIQRRLSEVEFYVVNQAIRNDLRQHLKQCPDLERALSRLSVGRGGPRDLDIVRTNLNIAQSVFYIHQNHADSIIQPYLKPLTLHDLLDKRLEKALRDELPMQAKDGYFIRTGYFEALDDIREVCDKSQNLITKLEEKYRSETGIQALKIKKNNVIGYFIEIKPGQKSNMDQNYQFIHRQSLASAIRYQTFELTELEQKISTAAEKALQLEIQIFNDLVQETLSHLESLHQLSACLAHLDVASSLAELAEKYNYTKPQIDTSTNFQIVEGRHPVVEQALEKNQFTPNDCQLSKEQSIWLLTGPNMAGKSTFLRQNALIIIMAQMGSFIPAKSGHIGIVDKLFSRIGAADDLAKGHSTFMVEMIEAAAILNQSTSRSFVILDELGRGTATFDGLSIAWSCLEYLHNTNQCRSLFATHYHELTKLEASLQTLACYHMAIKEWEGEIRFLHRVKAGATEKSYGIQVAKLAGLPQSVWQRAQEVLLCLEKEGKNKQVNQTMPLFHAQTPSAEAPIHPIVQKMQNIDINDLSPKQAWDKLYELISDIE